MAWGPDLRLTAKAFLICCLPPYEHHSTWDPGVSQGNRQGSVTPRLPFNDFEIRISAQCPYNVAPF